MSERGEEQRRLFRGLGRVSDVETIDYRAVCRNKCVTPIPRSVQVSSLSSVIHARASNEAFGAATQFLKPFNPFPLDRRERQQYRRARGPIIFISFTYTFRNTRIRVMNNVAYFGGNSLSRSESSDPKTDIYY